jgi:ABC-type amino acid transport substrate-binding protein
VALGNKLPVGVLIAAFVLLSACGIPRDTENTLEDVTGGTMRVGVTEHEPWVLLEGSEPTGVEVEIVKVFAEQLDADIEWIEGSEEELADAVEMRTIDLAIGGFTSRNMWASKMTLTHPYLTTQIVVAVPPDSDIEEDITGVEVAVEKGTSAAGVLAKTDARPVYVEDVTEADGPRAIESYLVDDLDLRDTGLRLEEIDHSMAVPHGENAWLVRLERYLLGHSEEIDDILEEGDL